jgi:flagellar protein FlaG
MDVNNSISASANISSARAYSGGFEGRSAPSANVEPIRVPDRPQRNSNPTPERLSAPTVVNTTVPTAEPLETPVASAPRLSDMMPGMQYEEDITESMLDRAFDDANRVLAGGSFSLSYSVHEGTGRVQVQVLDQDSGEVIREVPPEARLDIYARITEFTGLLFDRGR